MVDFALSPHLMRIATRILSHLLLIAGILYGICLLGIAILMEGMRHNTPTFEDYFRLYRQVSFPLWFFSFLLYTAYVRRFTVLYIHVAVITGITVLGWLISDFRYAAQHPQITVELEIAWTDTLCVLLALAATACLRATRSPRAQALNENAPSLSAQAIIDNDLPNSSPERRS